MKKLAILFLFPISIFAQQFSGGYEFYMPAFDSTNQKYLPEFQATPINSFLTTRSDGHFYSGGKQIRFWGFNVTSAGCFPEKEYAAAIAARMRKMGINIIRFHHMDNPWSDQDGTIFDRSTEGTRTFHPEQLDKLHYFLYQLKRNGIYANINLHVSRRFAEADGIPDADDFHDGGKVINMFDPQLIELQKEYATQLLNSVNPYTNQALKNDPTIAMVEISNENTLYGRWKENRLSTWDNDGILTDRHDEMLDEFYWNFLSSKYSSSNELTNAWNAGITGSNNTNQIADGDFESGKIDPDWYLELHSSAAANFEIDENEKYEGDYSCRIDVETVTGTNWHIQFTQRDLSVELGKTYTVKFAAKADAPRELTIYAQQNFSPWQWYNGDFFDMTEDWQEFEMQVTPFEDNDGRVRFGFMVEEEGSYWLDNVVFEESGKSGLENGESADKPRRLRYDELGNFTETRSKDQTEFYIKIQKDYFDEIHRFLKSDLNVKVPIGGTNAHPGVADIYANSDLDFIDDHSYWDHPSYPNGWSFSDWSIGNSTRVDDWDLGSTSKIFGGFAMEGKPYTISEIGQGFPNRFQTELFPIMTAYGSYHNADALMYFQYAETNWDWESDFINGWWDFHRNPAQMVLSPIYAFAFRNNLIQPAENVNLVKYSKNYLHGISRFDRTGRWGSISPYDRRLALQSSIRIATFDYAGDIDLDALQELNDESIITTSTLETTFDAENGFVKTETPNMISITGKLNSPFVIQAGNLEVLGANDFGTVAWLSLTEEPLNTSRRSTLVISSKSQNSNMNWTNGNTNVDNDFGEAPTQLYPIATSLLMKIDADSIHLKPLSPIGEEMGSQTFSPISPGLFLVGIDQAQSQSPWYGIEAFGANVSNTKDLVFENSLKISPNPSSDKILITSTLESKSNIKISLIDAVGKTLVHENLGLQPSGSFQHWLNLYSVSNGVYFLKVQSDFSTKIEKIIKQ